VVGWFGGLEPTLSVRSVRFADLYECAALLRLNNEFLIMFWSCAGLAK